MRTVLEHLEQRKRRDVNHLAGIDQRGIAGPLLQPATKIEQATTPEREGFESEGNRAFRTRHALFSSPRYAKPAEKEQPGK